MKLLMITGDRLLAQGKKGAFYNTLSEFHKYWDRIDVITPRVSISHQPKAESYFGNVFIHSSPWPLILQPLWILREGLRILKANGYSLKTKSYLMTVHEYPPFYNGIGARMLWNRVKMPYVLEIHHIPGFPRALSFKEKLYVNFSKIFLEYDSDKASLVRVVNKKQTPAFLKQYGVPESKIKYIPSLYVDLNIFKPLNVKKEFDAIFIGRLVENKGINLLIEAAKKLKTQISNFKMIVVGDGPLNKSLKFKVKSLKLEDNFTFWGWARDQQEIAKLLNQSKILVMSSYSEGGPRVVAEAMACGVPVLATPVGIVPDIINDGESGKIIGWQSGDIALKARELLSNPEKYNKYSQAGIKIAEQFEKEATIMNYADKLQKLILK